jgi:hypothetical protein
MKKRIKKEKDQVVVWQKLQNSNRTKIIKRHRIDKKKRKNKYIKKKKNTRKQPKNNL